MHKPAAKSTQHAVASSLKSEYSYFSICSTADKLLCLTLFSPLDPSITWLSSIDLTSPTCGADLVQSLAQKTPILTTVIITAGLFHLEKSLKPDYKQQEDMYRTCAIGPTMIVAALASHGFLTSTSEAGSTQTISSTVILVSSESGSITLRHESEGGGAYGHHASKSALNMCGKLLALDLKEKGVPVVMLHPGFMRTEMTKDVGFDKFWDEGGAVTPEVAAESIITFVREEVDMGKTGQYWAPRGPGDIGTAEPALGKKKSELPTPMQLPW